MKNLYISAIIIIGLFMNMLPSAASALDYDDTDFEFEMTFDEEEFNNFDNENPAVTTAVAASTATDVETTVTTADTEVPPTASEPVTTTSTENIQPSPTYTSTGISEPPGGDSVDTTIPQNTTTSVTQKPTQKLIVFCSLSLKSESNNLLITAKTQAKQIMDSIGFINVSLCKFDGDKKLISKTSLNDMEENNVFIYADENRIQVEGGYYYQVSGWHSVSLSGKNKTIYNESEMVFAENASPATTAAIANNKPIITESPITTATVPTETTAKIIKTTVLTTEPSQFCTTAAPPSTSDFSEETVDRNSSAVKNSKSNILSKPIKNYISSSHADRTAASAKTTSTITRSHSQSRKTTSVSTEIPPETGDHGTDNAFFLFILSSAAVLLLRKHEAK